MPRPSLKLGLPDRDTSSTSIISRHHTSTSTKKQVIDLLKSKDKKWSLKIAVTDWSMMCPFVGILNWVHCIFISQSSSFAENCRGAACTAEGLAKYIRGGEKLVTWICSRANGSLASCTQAIEGPKCNNVAILAIFTGPAWCIWTSWLTPVPLLLTDGEESHFVSNFQDLQPLYLEYSTE